MAFCRRTPQQPRRRRDDRRPPRITEDTLLPCRPIRHEMLAWSCYQKRRSCLSARFAGLSARWPRSLAGLMRSRDGRGSGHGIDVGCAPDRLTSSAPRRLDRSNVDLPHAHHRVECALCLIAAGGKRLGQHARRDLPRYAPLIFAPTARTLLATIADDSVPVAVSLLLIVGGDLEREGFVMLERGAAVKTNTGDAGDREFHCKHVARLARRVIARRTIDGTHRAIRKRLGVEAGGSFGVLIVP